MKSDLVKNFGFPNYSPKFLFVKKGLDFGICQKDKLECYAKGGICRLNFQAGFQTEYDYANPQIGKPLRNRSCSQFKKVEK
jgi:hypothetical protein